jgi:hypothetical protein
MAIEVMGERSRGYGQMVYSATPGSCPKILTAMERAQLVALASPPCHECGGSVQRVETRWHLDEDLRWRPGPSFMVCADGHRVLVEPLV